MMGARCNSKNDLDQCVRKSEGTHSHGADKVTVYIRKIKSQVPKLARLSGVRYFRRRLESWHRAMRSNLATDNNTRPRFWKWIRGLRKECAVQEAYLINLRAGNEAKLKRSDKQKVIKRKNISNGYDRNKMQQYLESHSNIMTIDDV